MTRLINIKRSFPAPKILEEEKKKKNGTYNQKEVLDILKKDFHNKCYICETKATTLNIEHLVAHKGDKDIKFDWNNLFLSCGHCNNIKLTNYDDILDCTKEDVEKCISYRFEPLLPKAKVKIEALIDNKKVNKTIELLNKVYNGTTTIKSMESENIRKKLLDELMKFQRLIYDYVCEDLDGEEKTELCSKIKSNLKASSEYTSFKRWMIRDVDSLREEFKAV